MYLGDKNSLVLKLGIVKRHIESSNLDEAIAQLDWIMESLSIWEKNSKEGQVAELLAQQSQKQKAIYDYLVGCGDVEAAEVHNVYAKALDYARTSLYRSPWDDFTYRKEC